MRLILVAAAAALALTACNPAPGGSEPPAEPAPPTDPAPPAEPQKPEINGIDLTEDLRAVGTEPFWAMEITDAGFKFSGVDIPEQTAPATGPAMAGAEATWSGTSADNVAMKVVLTSGPCSDGMSDRTYPLNAKVDVGGQSYTGCAATIDALDRAKGKESGEIR